MCVISSRTSLIAVTIYSSKLDLMWKFAWERSRNFQYSQPKKLHAQQLLNFIHTNYKIPSHAFEYVIHMKIDTRSRPYRVYSCVSRKMFLASSKDIIIFYKIIICGSSGAHVHVPGCLFFKNTCLLGASGLPTIGTHKLRRTPPFVPTSPPTTMSHLQLGALASSQGLSLSQTVLRQSPSAAAVPVQVCARLC